VKVWQCSHGDCDATTEPHASDGWSYDPDTGAVFCDLHGQAAVVEAMKAAGECRNCSAPVDADGRCSYSGRSPDEPAPYHGPLFGGDPRLN
jgi:hypothetical protein